MLSPNCLLGHAEIDVFGQMHSDGGARNFVYGFHSSIVIETAFLLWRIASTCLLMINTSCIISFHKAKFLPSNFRISTLVPDVEAMFVWGEILVDLVFFFQLSLLILDFSVFRCRWTASRSDTTWCNECTCGSVYTKVYYDSRLCAQQTRQRYNTEEERRDATQASMESSRYYFVQQYILNVQEDNNTLSLT